MNPATPVSAAEAQARPGGVYERLQSVLYMKLLRILALFVVLHASVLHAERPWETPKTSEQLGMLQQAATAGDRDAQFELAYRYLTGREVERNQVEGMRWLRLSAEQGLTEAQWELGIRLIAEGGGSSNQKKQVRDEEKLKEAVRWLKLAADAGLLNASESLADCYFDGIGVPKDVRVGFTLRLEAARAGFSLSQSNLSWCYANGIGTIRDDIEAYAWLCTARANGGQFTESAMQILEARMTRKDLATGRELAKKYFGARAASHRP